MDSDPDRPPEHEDDGVSTRGKGPNRLGMAAGIAGAIAVYLFFLTRGLGLTIGIGAIILGVVARFQAKSRHLRTGMANVGIIFGLLLLALYTLTLYLESIWPV